MNQDQPAKIISPITGKLEAFKEIIPGTDQFSYFCVGSGYMSMDGYTPESDKVNVAEVSMPLLVRDLKIIDKERNIVWYPTVINHPKGMVFPDGPSKDNWWWFYAPLIEIPLEEQHNFPSPEEGKNYTVRLAIDQGKKFDKTDFKQAIAEIGLFIQV